MKSWFIKFTIFILLCATAALCACAPLYTVTFDFANGSEQTATDSVYKGRTIKNVPSPTKTGYMLDGWLLDDQKFDLLTPINANILLKASWRPISYKVFFSANGGIGEMQAVTLTYDEPHTLPKNIFSHDSYDFGGWNTKEDGSGTSFTDLQEVQNLASTQNATVVLYATWQPFEQYEVQFKDDNGDLLHSFSLPYGSTIALPEPPTKPSPDPSYGYAFSHWEGYSYSMTVTGNHTFTASYITVAYFITGQNSISGLTEYGQLLENIVVPSTVGPINITSIASQAFKDATHAKTIALPSTVTQIGAGAFAGCNQLELLSIPLVFDSLLEIFGGFVPSSLRTVKLTSGTALPQNLFLDVQLPQLVLAQQVQTIEQNAFKNSLIDQIVWQNATPPQVHAQAFAQADIQNLQIVVSSSALQAYKTAFGALADHVVAQQSISEDAILGTWVHWQNQNDCIALEFLADSTVFVTHYSRAIASRTRLYTFAANDSTYTFAGAQAQLSTDLTWKGMTFKKSEDISTSTSQTQVPYSAYLGTWVYRYQNVTYTYQINSPYDVTITWQDNTTRASFVFENEQILLYSNNAQFMALKLIGDALVLQDAPYNFMLKPLPDQELLGTYYAYPTAHEQWTINIEQNTLTITVTSGLINLSQTYSYTYDEQTQLLSTSGGLSLYFNGNIYVRTTIAQAMFDLAFVAQNTTAPAYAFVPAQPQAQYAFTSGSNSYVYYFGETSTYTVLTPQGVQTYTFQYTVQDGVIMPSDQNVPQLLIRKDYLLDENQHSFYSDTAIYALMHTQLDSYVTAISTPQDLAQPTEVLNGDYLFVGWAQSLLSQPMTLAQLQAYAQDLPYVELYAIFEDHNIYKEVTLVSAGTHNGDTLNVHEYQDFDVLPLSQLDNHLFLGWSKSDSDPTQIVRNLRDIFADNNPITLYAVFSQQSVDLSGSYIGNQIALTIESDNSFTAFIATTDIQTHSGVLIYNTVTQQFELRTQGGTLDSLTFDGDLHGTFGTLESTNGTIPVFVSNIFGGFAVTMQQEDSTLSHNMHLFEDADLTTSFEGTITTDLAQHLGYVLLYGYPQGTVIVDTVLDLDGGTNEGGSFKLLVYQGIAVAIDNTNIQKTNYTLSHFEIENYPAQLATLSDITAYDFDQDTLGLLSGITFVAHYVYEFQLPQAYGAWESTDYANRIVLDFSRPDVVIILNTDGTTMRRQYVLDSQNGIITISALSLTLVYVGTAFTSQNANFLPYHYPQIEVVVGEWQADNGARLLFSRVDVEVFTPSGTIFGNFVFELQVASNSYNFVIEENIFTYHLGASPYLTDKHDTTYTKIS